MMEPIITNPDDHASPQTGEPQTGEPQSLSVSELTREIKAALQSQFSSVWVTGEISDVARPRSGHVYLTLKDENAQIKAVIWKTAAARVDFSLEDGMQVMCRGEIDVYGPRGSYQLIVRQIQPLGEGALRRALRELQARLAQEGLFDPGRKRQLPRFPRRVALVTSPTGAAVRDFLEVARRRWPGSEILVLPTRVQGPGAGAEIVDAIRSAHRLRPAADVLVLTRGGGSIEDLWCFNEEQVVRALARSQLPTICGVGHEIDVTLCDLAADVRALTPSEAAERLLPSAADVMADLSRIRSLMTTAIHGRLNQARKRVELAAGSPVFRHPYDRIRLLSRRIDELNGKSLQAIDWQLRRSRDQLSACTARLESLSPLAVLGRGYSLTTNADSHQLIERIEQVAAGARIATRVKDGQIISRVEQTTPIE